MRLTHGVVAEQETRYLLLLALTMPKSGKHRRPQTTDASALYATPVTSLQQVEMFGVSRDGLLRTDSLQRLMGHSKCAIRCTVVVGVLMVTIDTVSPITVIKCRNRITLVLAFVARPVSWNWYSMKSHCARSVAPSGRLCVFIGISSDLAEEENNTCVYAWALSY
jgi:hypothetical protein